MLHHNELVLNKYAQIRCLVIVKYLTEQYTLFHKYPIYVLHSPFILLQITEENEIFIIAIPNIDGTIYIFIFINTYILNLHRQNLAYYLLKPLCVLLNYIHLSRILRRYPPLVHLQQLKASKSHTFLLVSVRIALMLHVASKKIVASTYPLRETC